MLKFNKDKISLQQQFSQYKKLNPPKENEPANANKPTTQC